MLHIVSLLAFLLFVQPHFLHHLSMFIIFTFLVTPTFKISSIVIHMPGCTDAARRWTDNLVKWGIIRKVWAQLPRILLRFVLHVE